MLFTIYKIIYNKVDLTNLELTGAWQKDYLFFKQ